MFQKNNETIKRNLFIKIQAFILGGTRILRSQDAGGSVMTGRFGSMKILYIKRAYNSRLHNQAAALAQRGHKIILLLESPIEYGYNGPGQWNPRELHPGIEVSYTGIVGPPQERFRDKAFPLPFTQRLEDYRNKFIRARYRLTRNRKKALLRAIDRVFKRHNIDLILSSNDALETEDRRTKWVIEGWEGRIPIVYECQDILSDCFSGDAEIEDTERFVNERSDAVIHTNPLALKWMNDRYRIKKSTAFPNYARGENFRSRLPKLSGGDGSVHLVYCGSVQQTPKPYPYPFARDMKAMFRDIAALGFPLHLHLGLYPGTPLHTYYRELEKVPHITLHEYMPFRAMMETLSRYDVGLFPVDLGSLKKEVEESGPSILDEFPLSRADTSKQYEYVLAGLPVLSCPLKWISNWLENNHFGASFHSVSHLHKIMKSDQIKAYSEAVEKNGRWFSIEKRISKLENFLSDIAE